MPCLEYRNIRPGELEKGAIICLDLNDGCNKSASAGNEWIGVSLLLLTLCDISTCTVMRKPVFSNSDQVEHKRGCKLQKMARLKISL